MRHPTGWEKRFDEPVPLPKGGELQTLREAGAYIEKLPRKTHDRPKWLTAIRILLATAEGKDSILHARIAMMKALYPGDRAFDPTRKDPHWGKRKLKRDQ